MKFTIRDLLLVTVIVAILTAWWLDRTRLHNELRRVEVEITRQKVINEAHEASAKAQESIAKTAADRAAFMEDVVRAREATRERDYRLNLPEGHLLGPPLPNPSSPAPSPPKN